MIILCLFVFVSEEKRFISFDDVMGHFVECRFQKNSQTADLMSHKYIHFFCNLSLSWCLVQSVITNLLLLLAEKYVQNIYNGVLHHDLLSLPKAGHFLQYAPPFISNKNFSY